MNLAEEYDAMVAKFEVTHGEVGRTVHWVATLRPRQITLGALVLIPARAVPDYADLSAEESADLFPLVAQCQQIVRHCFAPDRFNLVAAMMKDPLLHFHLIPRYSGPKDFAGVTWMDESWPALIDFGQAPSGDGAATDEILARLRGASLS